MDYFLKLFRHMHIIIACDFDGMKLYLERMFE